MAEVAEGGGVGPADPGGLGVVVQVAEVGALAEPHLPVLSDRELGAVVVEDHHTAPDRAADRPLAGQPLLRTDHAGAGALGPGVVLVDDRAPPVEHRLLDRDRAGSGSVDGEGVRRRVVGPALGLVEPQQTHEHRRHPLAVGDPVSLDGGQRGAGIEAVHDDRRRTDPAHLHQEREGCRVVQRRGRQVHGAGPDSVGRGQELVARRQLLDRLRRGGAPHALGSPGRPRRVEERNALDPFVARDLARPGTEDVAGVEVDPGDPVELGARRDDHGSGPGRVQHHAGAAVREDVAHLLGGQPCRHRRVAEPGVLARPHQGEEVDPVLQAERDRVARSQAEIPQIVGHGDGAGAQLGPGGGLDRFGPVSQDHDGGVVGPVRSVVSGVGHVQSAAAEPMRSMAISRCSICSAAVDPLGPSRRVVTPASR